MPTLAISPDILDSARISLPELKTELAVNLYAQGRLSLGKAHQLADMSVWEFRQILAIRRIAPHVAPEDLDEDVKTLRDLQSL